MIDDELETMPETWRKVVPADTLARKIVPADTLSQVRFGSDWGAVSHADGFAVSGAFVFVGSDLVLYRGSEAFLREEVDVAVFLRKAITISLVESLSLSTAFREILNLTDAGLLSGVSFAAVEDSLSLDDDATVVEQGPPATIVKVESANLLDLGKVALEAKYADGATASETFIVGLSGVSVASLSDTVAEVIGARSAAGVNLQESWGLGSGPFQVPGMSTLLLNDESSLVTYLTSGGLAFSDSWIVTLSSLGGADSLRLVDFGQAGANSITGADTLQMVDGGSIGGQAGALQRLLVSGSVFVNETTNDERMTSGGGYLNETGA